MRKLNIFLILLLSALLTVSAYMIWKEISTQQREKKEFDELLEIIEPNNTEKPEEETGGAISETDDETEPPATESDVQGRNLEPLFEKNTECIGWLCIEGTNINYPVMHTPSNPQKYLRKTLRVSTVNPVSRFLMPDVPWTMGLPLFMDIT